MIRSASILYDLLIILSRINLPDLLFPDAVV